MRQTGIGSHLRGDRAACSLLGALFAALGAWQLRRAETSRATRRAVRRAASRETVLAALPSDARRRRSAFARVEVRGEYVGRPQFLLDNMLHDGVAGYHVLTALRVAGRRERVLVNRGWVPAGGDRRVLPDVAVDAASAARRRAGSSDCRARACGSAREPATAAAPERRRAAVPDGATSSRSVLGEPVFDYQLLLDAGRARRLRARVARARRRARAASRVRRPVVGARDRRRGARRS